MRRPDKKPEWQKSIARERIKILFQLAGKEFPSRPDRSKRYVEIAKRLGMRYNIRLERFKRKFCRKCGAYLVPGKNLRARTSSRQRAIIRTCLECGGIERIPYRREKKGLS